MNLRQVRWIEKILIFHLIDFDCMSVVGMLSTDSVVAFL